MSGLVLASIYVYRYYFIPQVSSLHLPFLTLYPEPRMQRVVNEQKIQLKVTVTC